MADASAGPEARLRARWRDQSRPYNPLRSLPALTPAQSGPILRPVPPTQYSRLPVPTRDAQPDTIQGPRPATGAQPMEREHSGHLHSGDTPYHSHDDVDMAYLGMFHHDHGDHTHDDEPPPTPEQLAALG